MDVLGRTSAMEKRLLDDYTLERGIKSYSELNGHSRGALGSPTSAASAKELAELRASLRRLKICVALLAACGTCASLGPWYVRLPLQRQAMVSRQVLLASIPIVALLFTWFHIWLAIKMMFLPLRFIGLWQYGKTGVGIGWQGVVPRKCEKMARTAYTCARPYIESVGDWLKCVSTDEMIALLRPRIAEIVGTSLDEVAAKHCPDVNRQLPPAVRDELAEAAVEKIEEHFADLWREFSVLLCDKKIGIDNDGMVVNVFTENKELLNQFFMQIGASEFQFIERCGAALGFFCGLIQLLAFNQLDPHGRAILLPGTGFILGILTNYLAITACFWPVFPHPVRICGWHICNVQGLFLKRQKDVAAEYSQLLCENFFDFHKVIAYLRTRPELWDKLQAAYSAHNGQVFNATLGKTVTCFAPLAFGRKQFQALEKDLMDTLVVRFSKADEIHRLAGDFIATATDICRKNTISMENMPPDKFEDLLHPVFKEDEWILILLGGVLGAIVGYAQVFFLST